MCENYVTVSCDGYGFKIELVTKKNINNSISKSRSNNIRVFIQNETSFKSSKLFKHVNNGCRFSLNIYFFSSLVRDNQRTMI